MNPSSDLTAGAVQVRPFQPGDEHAIADIYNHYILNTTVTFEEHDGRTRIVVRDRYPSKEALDEAIASGSINWNEETFAQLDAMLAGPPLP